ncbi:MAG TPA: hypothetical protein VER11_16010 [Polyangiaceae bacterium]|nr:hypothetical protein [Polyangiaceae bacterium]
MSEVTTWVGVAASAVSGVVTIVTLYLRSRTKAALAAIQSGTPEAARIVSDAVTSVAIDTKGLTKEQLFELARQEIQSRDRRNARRVWAALLFTVVCSVTTVLLFKLDGDTYENSVHVKEWHGGTINLTGGPSAVPSR